MNKRRAPPRAIALVACVVACSGCDEFGNPARLITQPTDWKDARAATVTRTMSYATRVDIENRVKRGFKGLHHSDREVAANEVLTLVEVAGTLAPPVPRRVELRTLFELSGGTRVARRWSVPSRESVWRAAFALPSAPRAAVTEVVR